jgi:DNA-binding transcriptional regulator YdaS (Cro superfamily)
MDWKQQLKIQCDLTSQVEVAKKLGVSKTIIFEVVNNRYKVKNTKLETLVRSTFSEIPEINQEIDWQVRIKKLCKLYSVPAIATILGVSNSVLHRTCRGEYSPKKSKLKTLVMLKLNDLEERVQELDIKIPVKISRRDRIILNVIDEIFCAEFISYKSLREKFDKYVLSRTLNYLIAKKLISVVRAEKEYFKVGKPGDNRFFKLACNCSSPGIGERCNSCPLGKEIARIETGYLRLEEFEDAC